MQHRCTASPLCSNITIVFPASFSHFLHFLVVCAMCIPSLWLFLVLPVLSQTPETSSFFCRSQVLRVKGDPCFLGDKDRSVPPISMAFSCVYEVSNATTHTLLVRLPGLVKVKYFMFWYRGDADGQPFLRNDYFFIVM